MSSSFTFSSTFLPKLRRSLLKWVRSGTTTVVQFQQLCGVQLVAPTSSNPTPPPLITNPLLHFYFTLSSSVGNELFYMVAFPFLLWFLDATVCRRLLLVWGLVYYSGQSLKDLLRLPRPPSPPVAQLEAHYATEYGFPSTHAMASLVLPLCSTHAFWMEGYVFAPAPILAVCALWCTSVSMSRLYAGVHSVADLVGGLWLGGIVLAFGIMYGGDVDAWILSSTPAVVTSLALLISFVLVWMYPAPAMWTTAYGDTSLIVAAVAGCVCGQMALAALLCDGDMHGIAKLTEYTSSTPSASSSSPFTYMLVASMQSHTAYIIFNSVLMTMRMIIGCVTLFATRTIAKRISQNVWLGFMLPRYVEFLMMLKTPMTDDNDASHDEDDVAESNTTAAVVVPSLPIVTSDKDDATSRVRVNSVSKLRRRVQSSPSLHSSDADIDSVPTIILPLPISNASFKAPVVSPRSPQQFRLAIEASECVPFVKIPHRSPLSLFVSQSWPLSAISSPSLCSFPSPSSSPSTATLSTFNPLRVYIIEIPIKYYTYFTTGFFATCVVPMIFRRMGI